MKRRVEEGWRSFEAAILNGPQFSDVQRREMRRAFYAGAYVLMDAVSSAMSEGDGVTEADEQVLIDLDRERELYLAELRAGLA